MLQLLIKTDCKKEHIKGLSHKKFECLCVGLEARTVFVFVNLRDTVDAHLQTVLPFLLSSFSLLFFCQSETLFPIR